MQHEKDGFTLPTLGLGLVISALAGCFYAPAGAYPARSILLAGFVSTAGVAAAGWLFGLTAQMLGLFSGRGLLPRLAGWGFFVWFAAELGRTLAAAQAVCRDHFGSNALLAVVPLLLLASWRMDAAALDRSARAIWWLLAVGAAACVAGVFGQMHWQRLFAEGQPALLEAGWPAARICPEYFALPLLCAERDIHKGALLPFWTWGAGAAYALLLELVLGRGAGPAYTGLELLRAWSLGYFSRLDALLMLIWLAGALWRICLLAFVLRRLWHINAGVRRRGRGAAQ